MNDKILEENGIDIFNAQIMKTGNSLAIIIPSNIIKFGGYEEKDIIRVYVKKVKE